MKLLYDIKKTEVTPAHIKAMKMSKIMTADLKIEPQSNLSIPIHSFDYDSDGNVYVKIYNNSILIIPSSDIPAVYELRNDISKQILKYFYQDDTQSTFFASRSLSSSKNKNNDIEQVITNVAQNITGKITREYDKTKMTIPITGISICLNPIGIYANLPICDIKLQILSNDDNIIEVINESEKIISEIAACFHFTQEYSEKINICQT